MKKKIILIVVLIILIIGSVVGGYIYYNNHQKELMQEKEELEHEKQLNQEKELLNAIKNSYNEFVKTNKEAKLYKLVKGEYKEIGQVSNNTNLTLTKVENITIDNKYFKLANIDYYISYEDVIPSQPVEENDYYKNYVSFDYNIVTKSPTNFYINEQLLYSINSSFELSVIIDDDSYYYVEFDDRLFSIKKDNVEKKVILNQNKEVADKIAVLNYHFFYDPDNGEKCNETICLTKDKFEEQLTYLKENNFYTLTMKDLSLWLEKKIRLPEHSVMITIDDGAMGTETHLIELLEKYDMHGTLFLVTSWWPKDKYSSLNLEIQSHGHNLHERSTNGLGKAMFMTKEQILVDLKESIATLNGENTAFCYPFYHSNSTIISAVKEAGFKLGFLGGNVKITQEDNPYKLNRYIIFSYTTMNQFKKMVN